MRLSEIDRHVCLCVDKRHEHFKRVVAEFDKQKTDVELFIAGDGQTLPKDMYSRVDKKPPQRHGYPAWSRRPNSWNAFQSFRQIVETLKEEEVNTCGIYEDDVQFLPNFSDVLQAAGSQIEERGIEWDMLYLGANHAFATVEQWGDNLLKLNGSGCWHAVLINNSYHNMYDAILSLPQNGPIDQMAGKILHKKYNCYAVWPTVAIQKPGFSHCEGNKQDYSHYWKQRKKVIKK